MRSDGNTEPRVKTVITQDAREEPRQPAAGCTACGLTEILKA
jgi:hypothetical protein